MPSATAAPAVEGWFTTEGRPALLGTRCTAVRHRVLPPEEAFCRNPGCTGEAFDEVELSRTGRSLVLHRRPLPAAAALHPRHRPLRAVRAGRGRARRRGPGGARPGGGGYGVDDLTVGAPVELVVETLYTDDDGVDRTIWRWKPVAEGSGQ